MPLPPDPPPDPAPEPRPKFRIRHELLLFLVFGGLIAALIGAMFWIEDYGEKLDAASLKVHDAAEP